MELYFLLFLLAMLGFYLVGVGAYDDPHGRGINTYAEHVCRRRRDRGRRLDDPRRNMKKLFFYRTFQ